MKHHLKRIPILILLTLLPEVLVKANYFQSEASYKIKDVDFHNDEIKLKGDFLIPVNKKKPVPVAVFIHGSGTADRMHGWTRMFADHLAKNGIAVLIPDKRGSGKSEGDWQTAGFEILAMDAIAAVKFVEEQKETETGRVGVIGFSQGGHIAPLAATLNSNIDFVINVSGGAVNMEQTMIHEVTYNAIEEGLNPRQIAEMLQLHGALFDYAMNEDWSEVEKFKAQALNSDWKEFAQTLPLQKDLWLWEWLKKNGTYDPLPYWKKINVPVLVVYGEKDNQDKVMVWQSTYLLSKAFSESNHTDYLIKVYPDTGHGMFEPGEMYLHREFGDLLVDWIFEDYNPSSERGRVVPEKKITGYQCPPCPVFPHNDVIYEKPGTCPSCGMDLLPKPID